MTDSMTKDIERARAIVAAYGARPEAWPVEARDMVLRLMTLSPSPIERDLAEAQWLDAALDCHVIDADMAEVSHVTASGDTVISLLPFAAQRDQKHSQRKRQFLMAVSLAVAASVCGIVFGLSLGMDEVSQMRRIAVLQETQFLIAEVDQ